MFASSFWSLEDASQVSGTVCNSSKLNGCTAVSVTALSLPTSVSSGNQMLVNVRHQNTTEVATEELPLILLEMLKLEKPVLSCTTLQRYGLHTEFLVGHTETIGMLPHVVRVFTSMSS